MISLHGGSGAKKSPMGARCFVVALMVGLMPWGTAAAQSAVSVEEAVRAALVTEAVEARLEAEVEAARARVEEETRWSTPRLQVDHEQVFGDEVGGLEVSAMVEQEFDLSPGWRGALRESVTHREAALRAERDVWRLEVATAVRAAFYEARYHQARLSVMEAWVARLELGRAAMEARQEKGDVSMYAVGRLERELELGRARAAAESAALARAWSRLEGWTQWEERPTLGGALVPEIREEEPSVRPEIARLEHLERALNAEAGAWGAPFLRGWSLGVGYRYVDEGALVGHGLLVSLSVPLPLWNQDAPRLRRLRAEEEALRSERALQEERVRRQMEAAERRLGEALEALDAMGAPESYVALSEQAQMAYEAGEATLMEVLDAFESEMDLQLARLDLQWAAREAALALDRFRGQGVLQ